jgi:phosphatidylglycerophosphate synthase
VEGGAKPVHFVVDATTPVEWERRVCGLPVVRRHVLAAERAGARVVTVTCRPDEAADVAARVRGTRVRVRVDPMDGDELARARERWTREGAAVLPCDRVVSSAAACALAERVRPGRLVTAEPEVDPAAVALVGDSAAELAAAERMLSQSVLKPTDNVLARTNRRVSLPISRQLVKTGISPNTVTVMGLLLSLAAGALYGIGGYAFALAAAGLSWFSSMIDGCDGEVARLTFRESAFGCWLESVCDDLYYVAIFLGITLGLYRTGNARLALALGVSAVVGLVTVSTVHMVLRAKIAALAGGPQNFARFFEERMEALRADPVARFGRATYKLGTRSTLPYLLVLLALFGQTMLALVVIAIGTQIYWILSLYIWWATPRPLVTRSPSRTLE